MKSARNALPAEPANNVTCGIDWASDDHAVSIVDANGREIVRCTIEHNAAGLRELLAVLARAGVREAAIEVVCPSRARAVSINRDAEARPRNVCA